ncbi:hypothetical protein AW736_24225 [Termitidicoccus mucosus]|uniref:Resolvase n=2 Tax=Termitidicoccus mucosus TaxID=1184151 RepID=A0A178IBZ6_9BACT|nr:hypothetical protein AW736_24225 [Opitutaceae bacterium TSB47]
MDRPGIRALKRMIEAGEVKVVLVFKLERLSRNMDEWGPFRAFLQKHGCRLESATESISEVEPEGRLKNNIMMSVAEFERLNTAKKTRIKMREQAKRGYWNGGLVPYGYAYDKNTQALQPHPTEAPVLQRIFQEAAKLMSLTDIANALNADGLRTKERVVQRKDGKTETIGRRLFRSDGLRLIIQNPIYRGAVRFEGQEFTGKHEGLVSAEIWEKANAAAADIQERPGQLDHPSFQARDVHNHLFKGIAFCAACGRALVPSDSGKRNASGGKYRYYTCSAVLKEKHTAQCTVGRLSADALEKAVVTVLGEVAKHPSIIKEMVEVSRSTRRKDTAVLQSEVEKQKQSLASVEKQLDNCAIAISKGGVDVLGDALVRRASDLREQRRRLLVELERTRQELTASNALVLEEQHIRKNLERFREVLPKLTPSEQKEMIQLFIERIDVRRATEAGGKKVGSREGAQSADRLMEIRVKLHSAELAQGLEAQKQGHRMPVGQSSNLRGLSLDARVDFKNAMRGEITIIAPFRQSVRLDARVRTVAVNKPAVEHPVIRAQKWQRMLTTGDVPNRLALAKRVGVDPGMVTRVLKLVHLAPSIQEYLAGLKTANEAWHFSIKVLGEIADQPIEKQEQAFARLVAQFNNREERNQALSKMVAITHGHIPKWSAGPKFTAG